MAEGICVYGTDWCGDTIRARRCLARLGIEYTWFNIDKDKDACSFVERINKGQRPVPTILFPDGSILVEPSDTELEKKCKA